MSKSPLQETIDVSLTPDGKQHVLPLLRATIIGAWQKSALEQKDDVKQAAEARCYANMLKEVDEAIGARPVAAIPKQQSIPVSATRMAEIKKRQEAANGSTQ